MASPIMAALRSILDAFNRRARQEPPILRMPSRKLREEVPWDEIKFAWEKGLLWGISVGTKNTFQKDRVAHDELMSSRSKGRLCHFCFVHPCVAVE